MPTVLALPTLYNAVVARFVTDSTVCEQSFGWKEASKLSPTSARITWTPGNGNGSVGALAPARQPGRNPRPIATLEELVTVDIQAYDSTAPTSEIAQYEMTRVLFDTWYRAVYLAARGTFKILSTDWVRPSSGMSHGASIRVVMSVDAMIPDRPVTLTGTDTHAGLTVRELNIAETLIIPEVV